MIQFPLAICVLAQTPRFTASDAALTFTGGADSQWFGNRCMSVGDVTGDSVPDYIVAERFADANGTDSGAVSVFSGSDGSMLYRLIGEAAFDEFGHRCDGLGDIDGDGLGDFVVGAFRHDGSAGVDSGKVYVFSGVDGHLIYAVEGDAGDQLGHATEVCETGLLLGAYRNDFNGTDSGAAYIIEPGTGLAIDSWVGNKAGDWLGYRCGDAGDMDGDGTDDIGMASIHDDDGGVDAGRLDVYSGATGSLLGSFQGQGAGDQFGERFSPAGDVNGDGNDDVLVASIGEYVTLYSGFDGSTLANYTGTSSATFGDRVHGLGDINGDGRDDFQISAPTDNSDRGKVYVYSGSSPIALIYTLTGESAGDHFGKAVQEQLDLNGDGYQDFVISAWDANPNGNDSGRIYAYNGRFGRLLYTMDGLAAGDNFGYSLNLGGDRNADGLPEYTVGAVYANGSGQAFVVQAYPLYLGADAVVRGKATSVYATGLNPGETVSFYAGLNGATPTILLGSVNANQYGEASLTKTVPASLPASTVGIRAQVVRGGIMKFSNTVQKNVQ